jgi:hypothetical protein
MARTQTIEKVGIGWKPEAKSARDYIFADASADKMKTMRQLSTVRRQTPDARLLGPRRDQHVEGSCTGHGSTSAAQRITRQDGDRFDSNYSARFAYNMARVLEDGKYENGKIVDPGTAIKSDDGAQVRDAVLVLRKVGALPESAWRYRALITEGKHNPGDHDYQIVPSPSRIQQAHRFELEAQRCQTVEEVLSALVAGYPVVCGYLCHVGMWKPEFDKSGVLPMQTAQDRDDGGHCVCDHWFDLDITGVPGYSEGYTIFENSWSEGWAYEPASGIKGCGLKPLAMIRNGTCDDLWAVVKKAA